MTKNLRASIAGALLTLVLFSGAAFAQSYPDRPVRLLLPYNPGGIVDYVGRSLGQHLGEALGQTVVPENRPGAGGILGTEVTARAQPDGYTLLLMDNAIVINPSLQEHVPYDLKQLEAVTWVSSSPLVLVVTPALHVKTFDAFVAYAKANPGKLNFATAGVGTAPHLAAEMFKQRTGIEAIHVPYKGIGASYIDLMSNKIQFSFSSIAGALPFTTDNRVIPLATTGEKRSEVYPDTPTMTEAGLKGYSVDLWLALFAPAGMPDDVKAKLTKAVQTAVGSPGFKTALATIGATPRGTSPGESAAFIKDEYAKWKQVITEGKIRID
ncbi:MAG: tripartite tricarboxylate transporter substrate binding protein [Hyphomicrobiales bacterium]|nr:tripartite tricarboxylate transporter substrate binding protein [Hyphomicrobiales bacterium]MBV9426259.1 tripartite tricarboxylate transporter substrate binding protein [Bradyrhizobiaceae bacterium]